MTSKLITVGIGVYRFWNAAVSWVPSSDYGVALKTWFRYLVIRVRDRNGIWATCVGLFILSGLAAFSHN
jgi:hypothetical protein